MESKQIWHVYILITDSVALLLGLRPAFFLPDDSGMVGSRAEVTQLLNLLVPVCKE